MEQNRKEAEKKNEIDIKTSTGLCFRGDREVYEDCEQICKNA